MVFQCINIRQVLWEVLKTAAFGLGFQHLPRELANFNAWKTIFDPYIVTANLQVYLVPLNMLEIQCLLLYAHFCIFFLSLPLAACILSEGS